MRGMMRLKIINKPMIVIFTIKGSTIKRFIIFDLIFGTGLYMVVKIYSSSVIVATLGSLIGTEAVKKINKYY
jgi:hypothetical protein